MTKGGKETNVFILISMKKMSLLKKEMWNPICGSTHPVLQTTAKTSGKQRNPPVSQGNFQKPPFPKDID